MLTFSEVLVSSGDMSLASVTSPAQQMTNMIYMSIQCAWTDVPVGVFKVQACNDHVISSSSVWSDLGSSSVTINGSQPAGSASNLTIDSNSACVPWGWVRLVYTKTSGTGSFTATMFAKGA